MYNPDAENVNSQAPQFYEPIPTQYNQPYREYSAYPAYPASRTKQQPYQPNQQYPPHQPHQTHQPYQSRSWSAENTYAEQGEKLTVRPRAQSLRYKEGKAAKISKAQALVIVKTCKKWLVIGSVLCFGVISGLVITHATGITSQAATNNGSQQAAPSTSGQGGFFQQQQGGYGFGNNGTSQGPVSGTRVS